MNTLPEKNVGNLRPTVAHGPGIMGGMIGLPPDLEAKGTPFSFPGKSRVDLSNGRCGLLLLIELLSPRRVWLPTYLCPSMIITVEKTGRPLKFFEMDYDLRVKPESLAEVGEGDLVDIVDYFGFKADRTLMRLVRDAGAFVLEDACQAMLTGGIGQGADFILMTPRKFVGVPDGGMLISNRAEVDLRNVTLQPPPTHWWMMTLSSVVLRREFDRYGGDRRWFELYRAWEEDMPLGNYAMSDLTRMLLESAFDYGHIARKRVENYEFLAGKLPALALYPQLPPEVVPLGFPVRLANRDEVLISLFAHNVYPPVHWPFQGILPKRYEESYRLVGDIMMLPCDQRYSLQDMERLAELVEPMAVPID